jgi:hypothetical protein
VVVRLRSDVAGSELHEAGIRQAGVHVEGQVCLGSAKGAQAMVPGGVQGLSCRREHSGHSLMQGKEGL